MAVITNIQAELGKLSAIPNALRELKIFHDDSLEKAVAGFQAANQAVERFAQAAEIASKFGQQVVSTLPDFVLAFEELPERIRLEIRALADHSWYMTLQMPCTLPTRLAKAIAANKIDAVNTSLCEYFEAEFVDQIAPLFAEFPERQKIIETAFSAHQNKMYELSVPVLLCQADGICQEMTGIGLYSKENGDRQLKSYVESLSATGTIGSYLHPLEIVLPIIAPSSQRIGSPDELNRHAILHGESTNYATRVNSCKSMSLVAYLYSIIDHCRP